MTKAIFKLALALILAVAVITCVSWTKKDNALVEGKVSYTIINNTGKNVTEITLADTRSDNKVESKPGGSGLPDGESIGLELPVKLEKNAPDVTFGFTVEGGDNVVAHIMQQKGTITMVTGNDGITFQFTDSGKLS